SPVARVWAIPDCQPVAPGIASTLVTAGWQASPQDVSGQSSRTLRSLLTGACRNAERDPRLAQLAPIVLKRIFPCLPAPAALRKRVSEARRSHARHSRRAERRTAAAVRYSRRRLLLPRYRERRARPQRILEIHEAIWIHWRRTVAYSSCRCRCA